MEKETVFKKIFRKYMDDPRLPLFKHLYETMDDEERTLRELSAALIDFATEKWIATHDDPYIGGYYEFYAWWKKLDLSEWHEQLKSWLMQVMGKFYDEYDIERRFQIGGNPLIDPLSYPLFELKVYMSVLFVGVNCPFYGLIYYNDFVNPTSEHYDAARVYLSVNKALEMKSAKAAQH